MTDYIKLLNEEFYNNCIKVLKQLKISKFDIKKYEALTTMIGALEKVKVENQEITEEELNELKEGAKKLINKLKTKYNEILEEKFTKNSKIAKIGISCYNTVLCWYLIIIMICPRSRLRSSRLRSVGLRDYWY